MQICKDFPQLLANEFIELWREYEDQKTTASHYVYDFDKLDMLIQANQYELDQGLDLEEFFESTQDTFKTPYGQTVLFVSLSNSIANEGAKGKTRRTQAKCFCLSQFIIVCVCKKQEE